MSTYVDDMGRAPTATTCMPIQASVLAESGRTWQNVVTPEIAKVAETLDEFRGRYRFPGVSINAPQEHGLNSVAG